MPPQAIRESIESSRCPKEARNCSCVIGKPSFAMVSRQEKSSGIPLNRSTFHPYPRVLPVARSYLAGNHFEYLASEQYEQPIDEFYPHLFVLVVSFPGKLNSLFHQLAVGGHLCSVKQKRWISSSVLGPMVPRWPQYRRLYPQQRPCISLTTRATSFSLSP